MEKKVVFIMGTGHCGSTLLDLMIGSHSQAFSLGELHAISVALGDDRTEFPRICGVCRGRCEFWNRRVSRRILKLYFSKRNRLHSWLGTSLRYLYNPYKCLFKWTGASVLVDSSKQPYWIRKQLTPRYSWEGVTPYLIFVSRDGRAVVNSYLRKYPERGIEQISQTWKQQIKQMREYYGRFADDRRITVRYEELASAPSVVLQSVCSFLDLPFEDEMLSYWVHEHHHISGNKGTRSLILMHREWQDRETVTARETQGYSEKPGAAEYDGEKGLSIKLDERWKEELSPEQIDIFESIAGDANNNWHIGSNGEVNGL